MFTTVKIPKILLPDANTDLTKWAVIACDQHTSEPAYWRALEERTKGSPSMLDITYPEIYLGERDGQTRIDRINATMRNYIKSVLTRSVDNFILVERTLKNGVRHGLIAAVDLEAYSFTAGASPQIRATEGTILERIPPRVQIRKNAALESPHIMLLCCDEERRVIERIAAEKSRLEKLYDFELNMGGGHIRGYRVTDSASVLSGFEYLLKKSKQMFGSEFLFAVGDGNHSLATAKTVYENLKNKLGDRALSHPARYALVEIVNIFDSGITFEPIHRVVFGASQDFVTRFQAAVCGGDGAGKLISASGELPIALPLSGAESVRKAQAVIDDCLSCGEIASCDYVHGEDSVRSIVASMPNSVGIILNKMQKSDLFAAVANGGALARKTFSMGEAEEKRYYLECRKIVKEQELNDKSM